MLYTCSLKPEDNISSASSRIINLRFEEMSFAAEHVVNSWATGYNVRRISLQFIRIGLSRVPPTRSWVLTSGKTDVIDNSLRL